MNFFHLTMHLWEFFSTDKRGIDSRLASAQTALMLQEETIRRNERERKVMTDKINSLERSLAAADTEKRQQEVSWHIYISVDICPNTPAYFEITPWYQIC